MSWFICKINGENFPGILIDQSENIGFYTTRSVEADNVKDAESKALNNLKADQTLKLSENVTPDSNSVIYFENIYEVTEEEATKIPTTGFTFYTMEE